MEQIKSKKWSKLAIISFILIALIFIYTCYSLALNWYFSFTNTSEQGRIAKTFFFGDYSFWIFLILLIMNIVSLAICIKKNLKGKILSILGIILSSTLIIYMIYRLLTMGPF